MEEIIKNRQTSVETSQKDITELRNRLENSAMNDNDDGDMKAKYKQYKERAIRYKDQENELRREKELQQRQIDALL